MIFCRLLIFFKINLFKKFLKEIRLSVKHFGSRSGGCFVGTDLGPNCLQRLSADNMSRQRVELRRFVYRKRNIQIHQTNNCFC